MHGGFVASRRVRSDYRISEGCRCLGTSRRVGRWPELLLLGLSLAPDLQAAGGVAASGRYLPAIQPLMAWSIALSTLLCYYPLELPISALARVGELFGICRRDHSGRAVRLGRREGRCPVGGATDSPSDWSGSSGRRITARRRG